MTQCTNVLNLDAMTANESLIQVTKLCSEKVSDMVKPTLLNPTACKHFCLASLTLGQLHILNWLLTKTCEICFEINVTLYKKSKGH